MQATGKSDENSFRSGLELGCNVPTSYCIRVIGELDEGSFEHLKSFEINTFGQEKKPITTLTGPLPDQAALFKILLMLYDMRLPLLSIVRVEYSGNQHVKFV